MLYIYTIRFDIKEEQRLILQKYLLDHKIAASTEVLNIQTYTFEAISDNKEDVEIYLDTTPDAPLLSVVAAGKRPTVNSDDKEEVETTRWVYSLIT